MSLLKSVNPHTLHIHVLNTLMDNGQGEKMILMIFSSIFNSFDLLVCVL